MLHDVANRHVFFLGFEFQPPPASLDLVHVPFESVWDLKVNFFATFYSRILHFLLLEILFPIPPSLLKLVVRPGLETIY